MTQKKLSDLFGSVRSVITKHIINIFKFLELEMNSVVAKNATTASDGKNNTEQATIYKKKIKKNKGLSAVACKITISPSPIFYKYIC